MRRIAQQIQHAERAVAAEDECAEWFAAQIGRGHRPQRDVAEARKPGRKTGIVLDTIHRRAPPRSNLRLNLRGKIAGFPYENLAPIRDARGLSPMRPQPSLVAA